MAAALVNCRIRPSAHRCTGAEDVVCVEAQLKLSQHFGELEGIHELNVREAVSGQRTVHVLRIVKIHPADVRSVPHSLEAAGTHCCETVQNGGRRIRQGAVAVVDCRNPVVPVFHILGEIKQPVAAQGGVGLERKDLKRSPACCKLHSGAIGVRNVGGKGLAYVAQFARLHQLVAIAHIVESSTGIPSAALELIAQLAVQEFLCLGCGVMAVVREVVALGLAVGISHRCERPVAAGCEVYAGLGVDEVVALVYVKVVTGGGAVAVVYVLVVVTVRLIMHVAVLHIAEETPGV